MGGKKVQITFEKEQIEALEAETRRLGLGRVSTLVKHLSTVGIAARGDADERTLLVRVGNWRELSGYVRQKKLGGVETFAVFAMEQYMSRYPLTGAQKKRVGETVES